MITKNAVVSATDKVFAEYGNVGTHFEYIAREGFGWMNASYIYGLSLLPDKFKGKINKLISPEDIF